MKKFMYTVFLLSSQLILLSCSNDEGQDVTEDPDPEEPSVPASAVTTLVESLGANDGLAIDQNGNVYASNFGNWSATGGSGAVILKITPDGSVTEYTNGLSGPLDIEFDENGNLFAVNDNNGTDGDVIQVMSDGSFQELATIPGWPAGIVSDGTGNLFISNYLGSTIHKLESDGTLSVIADDSRLAGCVGIDMDENGLIYTANYNDGKIYSVTPTEGTVTLIATIAGVSPNFGIGYMTYFNGAVYATGIGTNKIYKVDPDGSVEDFAGSGANTQVDGSLLEASFKNPNGIAVDETNKLMYILDWGKPSLRKIELE